MQQEPREGAFNIPGGDKLEYQVQEGTGPIGKVQYLGQVQLKYQVVGKYSTWGRCSQSTRWWESTVPGAGAVKVPGGGKVQYLGQVQSKYQGVGK